MEELKIGDIVELNSGGPDMTVQHVSKNNIVGCYWNCNGKTEYYEFPSACLNKK